MIYLAATATTADRLQRIPTEFWLKMGLAVLIIVVVVTVLRKLAHVNKAVLSVIVGLVVSIVGFNWIYQRNEPTWATPAVSWLSGWFPSKGQIEKKKSGL